jgi:hypothetical protein
MKSILLAAAIVAASISAALAGNTVLFSSKSGDVVFPLTPTTIDSMAIGQTTPAPGTFTDLKANAVIAGQVYNTDSQTATIVLTGADISGAAIEVDLGLTGAITTAQNAQVPTLASLLTVLPSELPGQTWKLRVINVGGTSSGAFTVTTNTGWTLTGTMSIAINTWRDFIVKLSGSNGIVTAATLQSVGTGSNS